MSEHASSGALGASLLEAASQTFESLGYFFVEPLDPASAGPLLGARTAAIDFTGPNRGTLLVSVTDDVLGPLAANMLGRDDPPDEALQLDALGEVANVICGSVLPALGGARAVFSLAAPRVTPAGAPAADPIHPPAAQVSLDIEGGRADVVWYVG